MTDPLFSPAALAGKRAMVTGASSGLGRHFARVLARAGAVVTLAARRVDKLEALRGELKGEGADARVVALDIADMASIAALGSQLDAIDILVNNAGVSRTGTALKVAEADWDAVIDTNLKGLFFLSQRAAQAMKSRGAGGSIINIASITGMRQSMGMLPYNVSKAGVIHLTKTLALELARSGVRVNAIAPGSFRTEITGAFWDSPDGEAMMQRIPQRRLGAFEDLDGPLLLLASDASRYMTGSVIVVDGGQAVGSL
jgi:NAD(P)-dependent dehydrogenase (short-subunit alcohol dehydrogenase family)